MRRGRRGATGIAHRCSRMPMTALRRLPILLPLLLIGAIVAPASAGAAEQTFTYTQPITVSGYEVRQGISAGQNFQGVANPDVDGHITKMEVDIVDAPAGGDPVPISRLMLHHIVFLNVNERDRTCDGFRDFGGNDSYSGLDPERFYAAGEERAKLFLPPGYGYRHDADDFWAMTYMVMNHRKETDTAWIQWKVTIDDDRRDRGCPSLLARRAQLPRRSDLQRPRHRQVRLDIGREDAVHDARERPHRRRRRPRPRRRTCPATGPAAMWQPPARLLHPDLGDARPPLLQRQADPARARPDQHERLRHPHGDPGRRRRDDPAQLDLRQRRPAHPRDGDHDRLRRPRPDGHRDVLAAPERYRQCRHEPARAHGPGPLPHPPHRHRLRRQRDHDQQAAGAEPTAPQRRARSASTTASSRSRTSSSSGARS